MILIPHAGRSPNSDCLLRNNKKAQEVPLGSFLRLKM